MGIYTGLQQFKAALHVHTTNSDGSVPFATMVEAYYARDYDLLAITDHNMVTRSWNKDVTANGLDADRLAEIASGSGRGDRPMLRIPDTTEQSRSTAPADHINTFMTDYTGTNWPVLFAEVERQNGVAHINHLGRYPGIAKHVELLRHPYCVGIEMISTHYINNNDRVIWDQINTLMVPTGKMVWGFATDDAHLINEVGQCWTVMVMREPTLADFTRAMRSGSFYGIARRTQFEGVISPVGDPPVIRDIEVSFSEITITAENYHRIEWLSEGRYLVDSEVLHVSNFDVGSFVRANVIGLGGVAFTQPIRVFKREAVMPIEVLARLKVPIAPIDDDEVARKGDLVNISAGVGFFSFEQEDGNLYFVFDLGVREDMFTYDATTGDFYYNLPESETC